MSFVPTIRHSRCVISPAERMVEEARAWYDSPAYREVAEHRFRGSVYRGLIVERV